MKEVTIYECADGTRFGNKEDAEQYEKLVKEVKELFSKFRERPDDRPYAAIQQPAQEVLRALYGVVKLCKGLFPIYDRIFNQIGLLEKDISFLGTTLRQMNCPYPILYDAAYRLAKISFKTFLEYPLAWYANNEEHFSNEII